MLNYGKKKEDGPPITFNTRYKVTSTRGRSRDPSPAADFDNNPVLERISASRDRSRERIANIKEKTRDPSPVLNRTTRISRLNSNTSTNKEPTTYNRTLSSSALNAAEKKSSSISNIKEKLRDPSPVSRSYYNTISNTREKSRDPSPVAVRRNTTTTIGNRSRDPSPVSKYSSYNLRDKPESTSSSKVLDSTNISSLHRKLREPSPVTGSSTVSSYKRTSREPSPADFNSKFSSPSLYKIYPKTSTNNSNSSFSSKYGSSNSIPKSPLTDMSISYMTTDELRIRARDAILHKREAQAEKAEKPEKANVTIKPVEKLVVPSVSNGMKIEVTKKEESEESSSESETESETETETEPETKPEPKIMIQVTTITRGTSPTPPGSSYLRTRRQEMAKVVEKVRQRPLIGPTSVDIGIQSDRLDDSTRYTRFGNLTRATAVSLSSYSDPRYSSSSSSSVSKYSTGASRLNRENNSTPSEKASSVSSDKSTSKSELDSKTNKSLSARVEAARNLSAKSSVKSISPVKTIPTKDKSKSPLKPESTKLEISKSDSTKSDIVNDSLSSKLGSLKPTSSMTKVTTQTNGNSLANKDFRKSALNMGPAERPRKAKSTSSSSNSNGLESVIVAAPSGTSIKSESSKDIQRSSSESSESEVSTSSSTTEESPKEKFQENSSSVPSQTSSDSYYKKFESKLSTNSRSRNNSENQKTEQKSPQPFSCFKDTVQINYKLRHFDSGERPWWLDSDENETSANDNNVTEKPTNNSIESKIEDSTQNAIIESKTIQVNGSVPNVPNGKQLEVNEESKKEKSRLSQLLEQSEAVVLNNLHRIQSGETAWWMKTDSSNKSSSSKKVNKASENKTLNTMWENDTQADVSELQKDDDMTESEALRSCDSAMSILQLPANLEHFTIGQSPLGHRLSPDGLEDTSPNKNFIEESIPLKNDDLRSMSVRNARDFNAKPKMFISRHTNIDDLLGKICI